MFVALDKLHNQGVKKAIVAVPEKSIGRSFQNTSLVKFGFFADWQVAPHYNLCDVANEQNKVGQFKEFFTQNSATTLVCTHATLRFAMKELADETFNDCLLAIDEFHHASADEASGLGDLVRRVMANTNAHVVAMTGNPQIATVQDLYKIGFSTVPVEERIKNAAHEPTYLMDKVAEVARWKTLNMNTQTFENIIHRVFDCV